MFLNFLLFYSIELIGGLLIIIGAVYLYFKNVVYKYWEKQGVHYVEPTFLIGNSAELMMGKKSMGTLHEKFYEANKQYGYYGVYGTKKPALVVSDPDLIRNVLVKNFSNFHDRGIPFNEKIDPITAHIFFLGGARWKNLRAKLTPTFTSGKMKQMFNVMYSCADKMTKHLESIAKNRGIIGIKELSARLTTDVIVSTAFGIDSNCIDNPDSEFRYWGKKAFKPNLRLVGTLVAPNLMDIFKIPSTDPGVSKFFTNAFKDTVNYRIKNNIVRPDFMNLLIQLMKQGYVEGDDGKPSHISETIDGNITIDEAVAQAFVFFLAGFETTSTTISYSLYELSKECNKHIQDKLAIEINQVLKNHDGKITYESTQEMTYLDKVINETLRKYPPLPFLNRQCTEAIELGDTGLKIPKGMDIIIPVLGLHRDPNIYPDPHKFDPERFNEKNTAERHPYAYLGFGEGPRICIGSRFGFLQVKIVLISLLSKYKFSKAPSTPDVLDFESLSIVLMSKSGIELLIEPR
ncbi:cytochrome P450 6a2-like [Aphidius gifuensis]|uniref:cytochrome P450 6a2-like n=1 Tax=Aphidius gifuensis TaxID=684658 RepID=UPI001CDC4D99|nr:cytochrome P450 6a2-like [Aphidius gifuensis]